MTKTFVEDKRGSDCSGTDGASSRTVSLANYTPSSSITVLNITVNNASLNAPDFSYSQSTNLVTFTNALFDDAYIRIIYSSTMSSGSNLTNYASTLELARFMNILETVPARRPAGIDRPDETVGIGDNSNTKFYLDFGFVINGTYSLRYAASETVTGTALVESTHYNISLDDGSVTLTAAGVTAVGTANIYATYNYVPIEVTDTQLQEALDRAQLDIDSETNSHFADGTVATPDYNQETNEKHSGKGKYDRDYYTYHFPLPDVSTTVSGTAVAVGDATVYVLSTNGFPSSGIIGIETDKVTYTGKTTTTFTGCSGIISTHGTAINVLPYVVELSTSCSGSDPAWTVLNPDTEYDLDLKTGRIHIFKEEFIMNQYSHTNPPLLVPNRFRVSYIWGNEQIYNDIKRATMMVACKDLMHSTLRNKAMYGQTIDKFRADVDEKWIKEIIERYKNYEMSNT